MKRLTHTLAAVTSIYGAMLISADRIVSPDQFIAWAATLVAGALMGVAIYFLRSALA